MAGSSDSTGRKGLTTVLWNRLSSIPGRIRDRALKRCAEWLTHLVSRLLHILFVRLRSFHPTPVTFRRMGLAKILTSREWLEGAMEFQKAIRDDAGRMTTASNLRLFRQIETEYLNHVKPPCKKVLEIGPGLMNPFAMAFLFGIRGYYERYFGVDVGDYRWDYAMYGLRTLVVDTLLEPGSQDFESRQEAVAAMERFLALDALAGQDVSRVFHDGKARYLKYDGVRIDQVSSELRDLDFVFAQDVFEHLANPAGFVESLSRVVRPGGILYVDVDFKDHGFRLPGRDEWTILENGIEARSLNLMRAHEMIDGLIARHFDIVERQDTVKPLPPGRGDRFTGRFRSMSDEQLSILSSRLVCRGRGKEPPRNG